MTNDETLRERLIRAGVPEHYGEANERTRTDMEMVDWLVSNRDQHKRQREIAERNFEILKGLHADVRGRLVDALRIPDMRQQTTWLADRVRERLHEHDEMALGAESEGKDDVALRGWCDRLMGAVLAIERRLSSEGLGRLAPFLWLASADEIAGPIIEAIDGIARERDTARQRDDRSRCALAHVEAALTRALRPHGQFPGGSEPGPCEDPTDVQIRAVNDAVAAAVHLLGEQREWKSAAPSPATVQAAWQEARRHLDSPPDADAVRMSRDQGSGFATAMRVREYVAGRLLDSISSEQREALLNWVWTALQEGEPTPWLHHLYGAMERMERAARQAPPDAS